MKIGILRETKTPPDTRVPLTPKQCVLVMEQFKQVQIVVQPSPKRCYSDAEYEAEGIVLQNQLEDCDVLLGVKEVDLAHLISDKTYFFFSHTIKKQPYNRKLLQEVVKRHIRLIDYECLTDELGRRLIAFGRWAGIVGAHNTILTWGKRKGLFSLPRMVHCKDFDEAKTHYNNLPLQDVRLVLTGNGRVANGAAEVLDLVGLTKVDATTFLNNRNKGGVYTQLAPSEMFTHPDGGFTDAFFEDPRDYHSVFVPYTQAANVMINGIYWDNRGPALFTREDCLHPDFSIEVMGDITCDIAPEASVPTTLRPATISEPVYGYDATKNAAVPPYEENTIDVMAVDNLPNELPRDASQDFGRQFIAHIAEELIHHPEGHVLSNATIARGGSLNQPYLYLTDYLENNE